MANSWRFHFVITVLLIAFAGLVWRMLDLTVLDRAFLKGQGDARTLRTITIPAYRGMITDRNGEPLAISSPVDSVWVNPQEFKPSNKELITLASLTGTKANDLLKKIALNENREFVYLKRGMEPDIAARVKDLKIPGIYLQREYRRYYPEGEVTAHILGFTNVDDKGQEGLELAYNDWLQGIPGIKRVLKDRLGYTVANVDTIREPHPGRNLALSIDSRIQYIAYRELKAGVEKFRAESGSAVVLDIKTGEILAMVNQPSYNPNSRPAIHDGRYRNRAVTDVYEPGSTIKAFSMASALSSGKYKVNSVINTAPGWIILDGKRVADEHGVGIADMTTILQRSSNVGIAKITISLPPANLWNFLNKVGFGQVTDSGFPGERAGSLVNRPNWGSFVLATLSFGYGMSVTTLQLAQAYMILANKGLKIPITFLKIEQPPIGKQVLNSKVCEDILTMLESVLQRGGTAPLAKVPGYRVTGKTGTSRIVGPHGYEKNRHNSSFVGIAPASNPRLLVAVLLNDPSGEQYYAGYTAGPIFAQIMGNALRLLDIPPDDLASINTRATEPSLPIKDG